MKIIVEWGSDNKKEVGILINVLGSKDRGVCGMIIDKEGELHLVHFSNIKVIDSMILGNLKRIISDLFDEKGGENG